MRKNSGCFYCGAKEVDGHLSGCPAGIYKQMSDALSRGGKSDFGVAASALHQSLRWADIDIAYDEAVCQFERGFNDGGKLENDREPSNHPSYQLGLHRAVIDKEKRQCAERGGD